MPRKSYKQQIAETVAILSGLDSKLNDEEILEKSGLDIEETLEQPDLIEESFEKLKEAYYLSNIRFYEFNNRKPAKPKMTEQEIKNEIEEEFFEMALQVEVIAGFADKFTAKTSGVSNKIQENIGDKIEDQAGTSSDLRDQRYEIRIDDVHKQGDAMIHNFVCGPLTSMIPHQFFSNEESLEYLALANKFYEKVHDKDNKASQDIRDLLVFYTIKYSDDLDSQLRQLIDQYKEMQTEVPPLLRYIGTKFEKLENAQQQNTVLQDENNQLKSKIGDLERKIGIYQQYKRLYEKKCTDLKTTRGDIETERRQVQARVKEFEDAHTAIIAEQQQIIASLRLKSDRYAIANNLSNLYTDMRSYRKPGNNENIFISNPVTLEDGLPNAIEDWLQISRISKEGNYLFLRPLPTLGNRPALLVMACSHEMQPDMKVKPEISFCIVANELSPVATSAKRISELVEQYLRSNKLADEILVHEMHIWPIKNDNLLSGIARSLIEKKDEVIAALCSKEAEKMFVLQHKIEQSAKLQSILETPEPAGLMELLGKRSYPMVQHAQPDPIIVDLSPQEQGPSTSSRHALFQRTNSACLEETVDDVIRQVNTTFLFPERSLSTPKNRKKTQEKEAEKIGLFSV